MDKQAYQFGARLALEKLGTSRWREALRSGEIQGEAADRMRAAHQFDPQRFARGAERGLREVARKAGAPVGYYQNNWDALRQAGAAIRHRDLRGLAEVGLDQLTGRQLGGAGAYPVGGRWRVTVLPERTAKTMGSRAPGSLASTLHHERAELEGVRRMEAGKAGRKLLVINPQAGDLPSVKPARVAAGLFSGLSGKPFNAHTLPEQVQQLMLQQMPGSLSGAHMSARPLLEDLREARLFGGGSQQMNELLRLRTGERPVLERAASRVTGNPEYFPRKRLGQIARQAEQEFHGQYDQFFREFPSERATAAGRRVRELATPRLQRVRTLVGPGLSALRRLLHR